MEIILKKDVQNLGFKDDIVSVKNGYGRNFLIPQGHGQLATPSAKKAPIKKAPAKKAPTAKKRSTPLSSYQGRKGEIYMSAAMKKHFTAVLMEWREHLKEEMQKTFAHLKNKGESYADPIDRASQEEEFAFELRTRDRERKLINKIAISLDQIKQDDYGYCYACGIEIGVKRLEARPTATHCVDCKTLDEIKEKQLGG